MHSKHYALKIYIEMNFSDTASTKTDYKFYNITVFILDYL